MGRKPRTTTNTDGTETTETVLTPRQQANADKKALAAQKIAWLKEIAAALLPVTFFHEGKVQLALMNPNNPEDTEVQMVSVNKLNPELYTMLLEMNIAATEEERKDRELLETLLKKRPEMSAQVARIMAEAVQSPLQL